MNREINLLLKCETKAVFRPSLAIYFLFITLFFMMFRFLSVYTNWGILSSTIYPFVVSVVFWYSRSIKGSGIRGLGFLLAPFEKINYVKAKYMFALLGTVVALFIQIGIDFVVLQILNLLPQNSFTIKMLNHLGYPGLLAYYPFLLFILLIGLSISIYTATCGKITYKSSFLSCLFSVILLTTLWDLSTKIGFLTEFSKTLTMNFIFNVFWFLTCTVAGLVMILLSYRLCCKNIRNFDIC